VSLSGELPAHFRDQATLAWPRCGAAASTVLQRPTGGAGQRPELDVRRFLPHTFLVFGPDLAFWGTETKSETPASFITSFKTSFKTSFRGYLSLTLPRGTEMFKGPIVCL